jgi:hypothetical protein
MNLDVCDIVGPVPSRGRLGPPVAVRDRGGGTTWTCAGGAISMACATGFALLMQARRVRTGRIEFHRMVMLY